MCRIVTGQSITNISDVQNLITAYIFSSTEPFNTTVLLRKVEEACIGCSLDLTANKIHDMIDDTIMSFLRAEYIDSVKGLFYVNSSVR